MEGIRVQYGRAAHEPRRIGCGVMYVKPLTGERHGNFIPLQIRCLLVREMRYRNLIKVCREGANNLSCPNQKPPIVSWKDSRGKPSTCDKLKRFQFCFLCDVQNGHVQKISPTSSAWVFLAQRLWLVHFRHLIDRKDLRRDKFNSLLIRQ